MKTISRFETELMPHFASCKQTDNELFWICYNCNLTHPAKDVIALLNQLADALKPFVEKGAAFTTPQEVMWAVQAFDQWKLFQRSNEKSFLGLQTRIKRNNIKAKQQQ